MITKGTQLNLTWADGTSGIGMAVADEDSGGVLVAYDSNVQNWSEAPLKFVRWFPLSNVSVI